MGFQGAVRNSGVIAVCILLTSTAWAQTTVIHPEVLRSRAGMGSLPSGAALASLKVAILDVGFSGYSASSGRLPESAQLNEGLVNPLLATNHGLVMAEIIWGMLGRRAEGPRFYLVNTNGLSNFRAAIEFVIAHEIDVVVYAQNWVYGGNLDGTGFVDALVTRALDAGVTWINAAGNDHDLVFAGAVRSRTDGTVIRLPAPVTPSASARISTTLEVTVALLWTDVQDDDRVTATTDLDVIFETTTGMELASGRHRQVGRGEGEHLRFARESAMATSTGVSIGCASRTSAIIFAPPTSCALSSVPINRAPSISPKPRAAERSSPPPITPASSPWATVAAIPPWAPLGMAARSLTSPSLILQCPSLTA